MTSKVIRVGIIGADTRASWAGASHVPALAAQPQLTLTAVATRRAESARSAAEAFGAQRWFADPHELVRDPSIDVVTVAVKVPAHRDLVLAALAANKAVYSESPLGATVAETEEMAGAVGSLHTAIGLQGRHNPSVRRAAEIIAGDRLGRVLSARVTATTFGNGPESVSAYEYFDKAVAGAGLLTIAAAHVLDVVEAVLGDITEIDARTELLWPEVKLADTDL
ncbi:MAG: Gfo/Idh/MocA family oxidoreductase, partial [Pseudonocardia sp.]|nr:Gfo/Idh/MocA family oxidoreductase [Pseudonocardia sp.]